MAYFFILNTKYIVDMHLGYLSIGPSNHYVMVLAFTGNAIGKTVKADMKSEKRLCLRIDLPTI